MLRKVMIICLALSFVFFGGVAFAMDEEPGVPNEGQEISPELAPLSGDGIPEGSGLETPIGPQSNFISPASSMIIAKDQTRDLLRDGSYQDYTDTTALLLASDQTQEAPSATEGTAEGVDMTQDQSPEEEGSVPIQKTVTEQDQDEVQS